MKKTSIYIDPDVDLALSRRASAQGTTKAALIRGALRTAVAESLHVKPGAGTFAGPADLAENADDHLGGAAFGAA